MNGKGRHLGEKGEAVKTESDGVIFFYRTFKPYR